MDVLRVWTFLSLFGLLLACSRLVTVASAQPVVTSSPESQVSPSAPPTRVQGDLTHAGNSMATDPQQLLVQSAMPAVLGFLAGIASATVGAYLTGLNRVRGEIAGRNQKIDEILTEIKKTAKQTEVSRIDGRVQQLESILSEVRKSSEATELGRISSREEMLDKILHEVREVTAAQKEIEARIAGGEWDRQWRANQLRDAYARLVSAIYGVRENCYERAHSYQVRQAYSNDDLQRISSKYTDLIKEFMTASALVMIFSDGRATKELDDVIQSKTLGSLNFDESRFLREQLDQLQDIIIELAREELGLRTVDVDEAHDGSSSGQRRGPG